MCQERNVEKKGLLLLIQVHFLIWNYANNLSIIFLLSSINGNSNFFSPMNYLFTCIPTIRDGRPTFLAVKKHLSKRSQIFKSWLPGVHCNWHVNSITNGEGSLWGRESLHMIRLDWACEPLHVRTCLTLGCDWHESALWFAFTRTRQLPFWVVRNRKPDIYMWGSDCSLIL